MHNRVNHLDRPRHHVVLGMVVKPEVADEGGSLAVDAVGVRHGVECDGAKLGILASKVGVRP
eukprot:4823539-Alexandrium_andersonii.AAC.1